MLNGRPFIAIVTARASEYEQQIMLNGIMKQADKYGMYCTVISNIYNFKEYYAAVEVENKIYELVWSDRLDGAVFMAESFSDPDVRERIISMMRNLRIPVVVAGTELNGFVCVDNDMREDFRNITRHLIEKHGFTDIDVLTGNKELNTSIERVLGVKDVLAEHDIVLDSDSVIYGNYWVTGGEAAAKEYLSGKRRLPQAIICANDYMAYGLMDTFFDSEISIPEDVTVVGYEYSGGRIYHSPVLTTYDRNREAVGAKAVSILRNMMTGEPAEDIPLVGCMICGDSCTCGTDKRFLGRELNRVRTAQFYNNMNICGNFEQQLTVCRSIDDYIHTLQSFAYLVRDLKGLYVCLYENWCSIKDKASLDTSSNDEIMTMYRIISPMNGDDSPRFFQRRDLFPETLPGAGPRMYLYLVPMFSDGIEIGHFVFQYTEPDGYDTIVMDWINTAVNALMILRMKNDINELLEYNNLSEFHDSATGLYNKSGLCRELEHAISNAAPDSVISVVMVKTSLFTDESRIDSKSVSVRIDTEIASCLKKLNVDGSSFCAKLPDKSFIFAVAGEFPENYHESIADRITALIIHSPIYSAERKSDTVVTAGITVSPEKAVVNDILSDLSDAINSSINELTNKRKNPGFEDFSRIRTNVYRMPFKAWDAAEECRDMHLSCGHFRAAYKNIFGVSFHRDVIMSRISLAKYLLITTALSLPAVAFKCGYEDDKYFLRQFRQITGVSPNTYRKFGVES